MNAFILFMNAFYAALGTLLVIRLLRRERDSLGNHELTEITRKLDKCLCDMDKRLEKLEKKFKPGLHK